MEEDKLPFTAHLEELRKRLISCIIAVVIGFAVSYAFSEYLFQMLSQPARQFLAEGDSFVFTGLTEAFFTYLKLAIFSGIFLASPVILYQAWSFVAPGLYAHEKKYVIPFVILSTIFFVSGVSFCFFVVFPIACRFFAQYANDYIRMTLKLSEYLSFSCKFMLAFGVIFELPIFILFLSRIGVVNARQLRANRKYVLVCAFVVAAILTPPDIVSQILMALPLLALYEISIIISVLFGKKREEYREEDEAPEEDDGTRPADDTTE